MYFKRFVYGYCDHSYFTRHVCISVIVHGCQSMYHLYVYVYRTQLCNLVEEGLYLLVLGLMFWLVIDLFWNLCVICAVFISFHELFHTCNVI